MPNYFDSVLNSSRSARQLLTATLLLPFLAGDAWSGTGVSPTNPVPAAQESQARYLETEALEAFARKDWTTAAQNFEQLQKKFPGHPGVIARNRKWAQALIALRAFDRASQTLRSQLSTLTATPEALASRLDLAYAELELGHAASALSHAKFVLKAQPGVSLHRESLARALLLRAESHFELKQWTDAQMSLDSAFALLSPNQSPNPELLAWAQRMNLSMRGRLCESLGAAPTEEHAIDLANSQFVCLKDFLGQVSGSDFGGSQIQAEKVSTISTRIQKNWSARLNSLPPELKVRLGSDLSRFAALLSEKAPNPWGRENLKSWAQGGAR